MKISPTSPLFFKKLMGVRRKLVCKMVCRQSLAIVADPLGDVQVGSGSHPVMLLPVRMIHNVFWKH